MRFAGSSVTLRYSAGSGSRHLVLAALRSSSRATPARSSGRALAAAPCSCFISCFDRLALRLPRRLLLGRGARDVVALRRGEEGLHAVVVALADGIELVIVAAGAAERHAEQRRADDVGHLGEHFVAAAGDFLVAGVLAQRPQAVEAGGDQRLVFFGVDLVAGELLVRKRSYGLSLLNARIT